MTYAVKEQHYPHTYTQFQMLNMGEKAWAFIGLGGQLSGICGHLVGAPTLNLLADDALYFCVATSVFLTNKLLVAYSLMTVVAVYGLFRYYNFFLLTGCEWSLTAKIAAPLFIIALASKLLGPRKLITAMHKRKEVSWVN